MFTIVFCSSTFSVIVGDSIGAASLTAIEVSIVGFTSIVVFSVSVVVLTSGNCKNIRY
jgi:hypothetical protein